jgi:hypothetical protein
VVKMLAIVPASEESPRISDLTSGMVILTPKIENGLTYSSTSI